MPKGLNLQCAAGEDRACMAAREGRRAKPGQAAVLLPPKDGETAESRVAYRASLRQALIDDNAGHVNVVVCEADYMALMLGIEHLAPPM